MIEFRTLGQLALAGPDGRQLESVLVQPKRTALLAYLAVALPRGFHRRDTLLGLFWPDLDQDRARAALRKAVHHLRKAIGDEALIGRGDEELQIASDRFVCDAAAFDEAMDRGDAAAAIARYQGRFLEGFFVAEAPEFEQWLERQRARLHGRAFDAAWQLAERELGRGDGFEAAAWARRAAALAPVDEGAIRRLLGLLDRVGDRAGALHAYEEFARRLAAEFDIEPAAETQALAAAIRSGTARPRPTPEIPPEPVLSPGLIASPSAATGFGAGAPAKAEPALAPRASPAVIRSAGFRWVAAVLGSGVLVAAAIGGRALWRGPATAGESPNVVAVLPFTVRGAPPLDHLGEGMISLLGLGLDGAGDLSAVDPQAILGRHPGGEGIDPERGRALAASLGAGHYVVGDLIESARQLRITASLYRVGRPAPVGLATAEGSSDSLFGLVDRIAAQLIAAHRGDSGLSVAGLAGQTTHSLPALKAYLEGERQFRRGAFRQALSGFQEAIALDSTFALAYYRLAIAYGWASNDSALAAARQAVRWSARLAQPARDLVDALALYEQGNADQAERRYREIIARRPMEVDAIFQLGETLFHDNPPRGRPSAEGRPWFERALAFNQGDPPVIHLLEIAGLERDYPAFDSLVRRVKPESHFWLTGRMVRAFGRGTEAERRAVEQEFRSVTDRDLATVTLHALFLLEDRLSVERVVRLLDDPARPSELRLLHHLLLAHLEMSAGRWRAAERALASAATLDPVRAVEHAVVLHSLPGLPIPESRVKAVRDQLAKVDSLARPVPSELLGSADEVLYPELRHYLEGQLAIRAGSWREAADRAAAIERLTGRRDHPIGVGMAAGLRGASALGQGRPADALAALAPSMPRNHPDLLGYSPFPGFRHERWARAEAWRQRGLLDEALAGFASFAEHSPWGRLYLAPGHLRRAEIYEQLGRPEEAAQEYRRAAELWREGDEEFRAVADRARVKAGSPGA